jgi:hypothetical protein
VLELADEVYRRKGDPADAKRCSLSADDRPAARSAPATHTAERCIEGSVRIGPEIFVKTLSAIRSSCRQGRQIRPLPRRCGGVIGADPECPGRPLRFEPFGRLRRAEVNRSQASSAHNNAPDTQNDWLGPAILGDLDVHLPPTSSMWWSLTSVPCRAVAFSAAQISMMSMRSLSPAKSAALRVSRGSVLASAMAAMSRSASRRRESRPCARTAA